MSVLELFVYPHASFNAAAVRPEKGRLMLMVSSALLEGFEADELRFVAGHEVGHYLFDHHSAKATYQQEVTDPNQTQLQMLQELELTEGQFGELANYCAEQGIVFLSTPYSVEDVEVLERIGVGAYKVASGQIVELELLRYLAATQKPILLSTGMATLAEVLEAVEVIRKAGNDQLVVLQCHTDYPSRPQDANLRVMATMADALDVLVGYSDHTRSFTAAVAAVALGACVVERHLTLDRSMPGPDHSCSSDPSQMQQLVGLLHEAQEVLGSERKVPTARERQNMIGMRRSLVARRCLKEGTVLTWDHVILKRPGQGIWGNRAEDVLGRKLRCAVAADQPIVERMLS